MGLLFLKMRLGTTLYVYIFTYINICRVRDMYTYVYLSDFEKPFKHHVVCIHVVFDWSCPIHFNSVKIVGLNYITVDLRNKKTYILSIFFAISHSLCCVLLFLPIRVGHVTSLVTC